MFSLNLPWAKKNVKEKEELQKLQIAMMGGFRSKAEYFDRWGTVTECNTCGWIIYNRFTVNNPEKFNSIRCSICEGETKSRKATREDHSKYDVDGWAFADQSIWERHLNLWKKTHSEVTRITVKEWFDGIGTTEEWI